MLEKTIIIILIILGGQHLLYSQNTYYVSSTAAPGGDGSSWSMAFTNPNQALALAVNDDEIWVASGLYYPTNDGNQDSAFHIKAGVAMYGGFVGNETNVDQRDWEQNTTTLSGDIGVLDDYSDNSYTVVIMSNPDGHSQLDGFTVTKGYAPSSSPLLSERFRGNGGGIFVENNIVEENSFVTIRNCKVIDNHAFINAGGLYVYSIYLGNTTLTLENNLFNHSRGFITETSCISIINAIKPESKLTIRDNLFVKDSVLSINQKTIVFVMNDRILDFYFENNKFESADLVFYVHGNKNYTFINNYFHESDKPIFIFYDLSNVRLVAKHNIFRKCTGQGSSGINVNPWNIGNDKISSFFDIQFNEFIQGANSPIRVPGLDSLIFNYNTISCTNFSVYGSTTFNYNFKIIGNLIDVENIFYVEGRFENNTVFFKNSLNSSSKNLNLKKVNSFKNNIILTDGKSDLKLIAKNSNLTLDHNLFNVPITIEEDSTSSIIYGPNNIIADPVFLSDSITLHPCSRGVNEGITEAKHYSEADILLNNRVIAGKIDMGAVESQDTFEILGLDIDCTSAMGDVEIAPFGIGPNTYAWQSEGKSGTELTDLEPGIYTITVTDSIGCATSQEVVVPDLARPNLEEILGDSIVQLCYGEKLELDLSLYNLDSFLWPHDGDTSRIKSFTQSGIYSYEASDSCGNFVDQIEVKVNALPMPSIFVDTICMGDTLHWSGMSYTQAGIFKDTLYSSLGCDSIYSDVTVRLAPRPNIGISGDLTFCEGDSTILQLTAPPNYNVSWHDGDNALIKTLMAGSYNISLSNTIGCRFDTTIQVVSLPNPVIGYSIADDPCVVDDALLVLTVIDPNVNKYVNGKKVESNINLINGVIDILYISLEGCQSFDTLTFTEEAPNMLSWTYPTQIETGSKATIEVSGGNIVNVDITPTVDFDLSDNIIEIKAVESNSYTIEITTDDGCIFTETITFELLQPNDKVEIILADIFSPNGDGINDNMTIYASVESDLSLHVFDRWGNQVYRYQDIIPKGNTKLWSGDMNGTKLQPGVYVYILTIKTAQGTESYKSGNVTLVR